MIVILTTSIIRLVRAMMWLFYFYAIDIIVLQWDPPIRGRITHFTISVKVCLPPQLFLYGYSFPNFDICIIALLFLQVPLGVPLYQTNSNIEMILAGEFS